MAADGVEHQRVVGVEQLDRLFGRLRLDQRGEAADVAEHHRAAHAPAAEREARLLQVLRHLGGREAPHQLLLLVAQALLLEAGADARLQQHRVDRLVQVVLGAQLDAAHDVVQALERRGHDHRQVAQRAVGDELLEHLEAVHLRHLDVEQQQVEGLAAQHLERDAAVLGATRRVWPCSSRLRVSSRRLTLLSSTTSRRAGRALSHRAAPSARRRPRRSLLRARRARPASRAAAISLELERRAPAPPSVSAPKVLAFDLSECAARRKRLGVAGGRARRAARRASRGASSRKVSTSSPTKSAPAVVLQLGEDGRDRSPVRPCQSLLARRHAFSASTSWSTRIGLVR